MILELFYPPQLSQTVESQLFTLLSSTALPAGPLACPDFIRLIASLASVPMAGKIAPNIDNIGSNGEIYSKNSHQKSVAN